MQYFKDLIAIPPLPEVMDLEEELIKCISLKEVEIAHESGDNNENDNVNNSSDSVETSRDESVGVLIDLS